MTEASGGHGQVTTPASVEDTVLRIFTQVDISQAACDGYPVRFSHSTTQSGHNLGCRTWPGVERKNCSEISGTCISYLILIQSYTEQTRWKQQSFLGIRVAIYGAHI